MPREFTIIKGILCLSVLLPLGFSLKCYVCDNSDNPACGIYFKAYQFDAKYCGPNSKCGLQRQPAQKDGWIGVVRGCYTLGDLSVNESNGCRSWTTESDVEPSYTALYCFCDTDYCNKGSAPYSISPLLSALTSIIVAFIIKYLQ